MSLNRKCHKIKEEKISCKTKRKRLDAGLSNRQIGVVIDSGGGRVKRIVMQRSRSKEKEMTREDYRIVHLICPIQDSSCDGRTSSHNYTIVLSLMSFLLTNKRFDIFLNIISQGLVVLGRRICQYPPSLNLFLHRCDSTDTPIQTELRHRREVKGKRKHKSCHVCSRTGPFHPIGRLLDVDMNPSIELLIENI